MDPKEATRVLSEHFTVEDKRPERDYLLITCKSCGGRYSLGIRNGNVGTGNVLALLDEAAGHHAKADP